jgi:hypothetical protein
MCVANKKMQEQDKQQLQEERAGNSEIAQELTAQIIVTQQQQLKEKESQESKMGNHRAAA